VELAGRGMADRRVVLGERRGRKVCGVQREGKVVLEVMDKVERSRVEAAVSDLILKV
jgi:hypothetical protein